MLTAALRSPDAFTDRVAEVADVRLTLGLDLDLDDVRRLHARLVGARDEARV